MLQPFLQVLSKDTRTVAPTVLPFRVRRYRWYDLEKVMQLFYDTVHHVCAEDYSPDQLNVWAPPKLDKRSWNQSLRQNICFVAEHQKEIIGFGDLKREGREINRLYTHMNYQGMGVAKAILSRLEQAARVKGIEALQVESSLTGKSFYQQQGFESKDVLVSYLEGQVFFNYLMEKPLIV